MIYLYNNAHLNSLKRLNQSIKIYRFLNFIWYMETYCHCLSMKMCSQMDHRACNGLNLSSHSMNDILHL